MKTQRQLVIRELVEGEAITSQEQLRSRLRARGIEATQATLSRDIRELGLVKRTTDGAYRSVGAAGLGDPALAVNGLARAAAEFLRGHEAIGHLVVLRTDPGQAQTLAVALDRARLREVAGTIAGDDTILVICRSGPDAGAVVERLTGAARGQSGGGEPAP